MPSRNTVSPTSISSLNSPDRLKTRGNMKTNRSYADLAYAKDEPGSSLYIKQEGRRVLDRGRCMA